jgi:hypothetical protein
MQIKISKNQWEGIGKKAGWIKIAQQTPESQLTSMIQQIKKMESDFDVISATIPKEKWAQLGTDCDTIRQYFDNVAGRISTLINRIRAPQNNQQQTVPQKPQPQAVVPQQPQVF